MSIFDDLVRIRAFVAIAESGSITEAARKLQLTQPTLSRYLKTLERQSGTALIYRNTHRMQLSGAGMQLLDDARAILALVDESQNKFGQEQTQLHGHIKVFTTIDLGQKIISRLIARFVRSHPQISFELCYSNRPMNMLDEACDLGIVVGELTDDTVVAREIGKQERTLCAAPQLIQQYPSPGSPEDIKHWPWLGVAGSQFFGKEVALTLPGEKHTSFSIAPVFSSEGVTSVREVALLGAGIALLPDWLIWQDLQHGRLIQVLPAWRPASLSIHMIYRFQRHPPQRVRAFMQHVSDNLQSELSRMH